MIGSGSGSSRRALVGGRMKDNICEQCGTRNEPGAQFCVECQAFLPWNDTRETDLQALGINTVAEPATATTGTGGSPADVVPTAPVAEALTPVPSTPTPVDPVVPSPTARRPEAEDQVRVVIDPAAAEVVPG